MHICSYFAWLRKPSSLQGCSADRPHHLGIEAAAATERRGAHADRHGCKDRDSQSCQAKVVQAEIHNHSLHSCPGAFERGRLLHHPDEAKLEDISAH